MLLDGRHYREVARLGSLLVPKISHTSVSWGAVLSTHTHSARRNCACSWRYSGRRPKQEHTQTREQLPKGSFFLYTGTIDPAHRPILIVGFFWGLHATRCHIHPGSAPGSSSDKHLWKQTSQHEKQFWASRSEVASRKCLISELLTLKWRFPNRKGKLWIFLAVIKIGLMWMWVLHQWTTNLPPPQGLFSPFFTCGESMKEKKRLLLALQPICDRANYPLNPSLMV